MFILNDVDLSNYGRGRDRTKRKSRSLRNAAIGVGALAVAGGLGYLALKGKGKPVSKSVTKPPVTTVSKPKYEVSPFGLNENNPVTLPDNISSRQLELAKRGNLKALGIRGKEANTQSVINRLNHLFYAPITMRERKQLPNLRIETIKDVKNIIQNRKKSFLDKNEYINYVNTTKRNNKVNNILKKTSDKILSYNAWKKENIKDKSRFISSTIKKERDKIIDVTKKIDGRNYYYSRNNNNLITLTT
jgi:hypothetical protein